MYKRLNPYLLLVLIVAGLFTMGAGCSSDPNVEGGKLNMNNKDYATALTKFEKAIETNANNAEAWKYKAMALAEIAKASNDPKVRASKYAEMATAIGKARELDPKQMVELQRVSLSSWASEINDGVNAFNSSQAGMTEKASGHFKNATTILPDSTYAFELLGRSYYKMEKYEEAAAPYEQAIKSGKAKEDTYVLLGNIYLYLLKDRATDALRVLEAASAKFPANEQISTMLTDAYRKSGQADRALASYKAQDGKNPNDFDNLLRWGNLLLQLDRFDEAMPILERALALKSEDENAVYNIGIAYFNKAAAVNKLMVELKPDETQKFNTLKADRDGFFRKAMPLLEKVRAQNTAAKRDNKQICQSLFSIYAQILGTKDPKTTEAYTCAGN
ncbi:MAG: tetratricopeptide repeat protein [Bacteroidetes Order II. Incertae sedis bacterium]|nr:tetratricopeptide repeat protein [Bacteroidetes Order II. bacterium]